MKILALEFSTSVRNVAVWDAAAGQQAMPGWATSGSDPALGTVGLTRLALERAGLAVGDITHVVIGLGPGSYTGIRMAIAFAQGWQLARPVSLIGLGTALCLAHQFQAQGRRGPLQIILNAQRNEFALTTFMLGSANVEEIEPIRLVPAELIERQLSAGDPMAGPDLSQRFPGLIACAPDARVLCRLARHGPPPTPGEQLTPVYLRATQFVKAPPTRRL